MTKFNIKPKKERIENTKLKKIKFINPPGILQISFGS